MNTNKHDSIEKVVGSILEHTTQDRLTTLTAQLRTTMNNQLSCFSCLSWLKNIGVHWCLFVLSNPFSVTSVYSVVKTGGAR